MSDDAPTDSAPPTDDQRAPDGAAQLDAMLAAEQAGALPDEDRRADDGGTVTVDAASATLTLDGAVSVDDIAAGLDELAAVIDSTPLPPEAVPMLGFPIAHVSQIHALLDRVSSADRAVADTIRRLLPAVL